MPIMQATAGEKIAKTLVQTGILGTRKGSDEPAYLHSFRVYETLRRYGFDDDVSLGGLLHDILEDSPTTFEDLVAHGFSARTIELVCLCSHDEAIEGGDARWVHMIGSLVDANDADAWAIKIADIMDNLRTSGHLALERRYFMREIKAPLILRLTKAILGATPLWKELEAEIVAMKKRTETIPLPS